MYVVIVKKGGITKGLLAHLSKDQCECELFTMKFHLLHHLCDDLEKFCSTKVLDVARYEHLNVILKTTYRGPFMRKSIRLQETAFALKPIENRLYLKGEMVLDQFSPW